MPREKVSGDTKLPIEWGTSISQDHVAPVIRFCTNLVEARHFASHAKIGENDLSLGPSFDFNMTQIEALGGSDAIDFVIATDMDNATVFANFDAGHLELRAKSKQVLEELLKSWRQESEGSQYAQRQGDYESSSI